MNSDRKNKIDHGIWYQSIHTGMWYTDADAAGGICAVRVNGITAYLPDPLESLKDRLVEAETLARKFHEVYEARASEFGYETRAETQVFDPITPNGRLMTAVCKDILDYITTLLEDRSHE